MVVRRARAEGRGQKDMTGGIRIRIRERETTRDKGGLKGMRKG